MKNDKTGTDDVSADGRPRPMTPGMDQNENHHYVTLIYKKMLP